MARWDKFFGGMAQGIPVGYEMGSQYQENQRKQAEEKRKVDRYNFEKDNLWETEANTAALNYEIAGLGHQLNKDTYSEQARKPGLENQQIEQDMALDINRDKRAQGTYQQGVNDLTAARDLLQQESRRHSKLQKFLQEKYKMGSPEWKNQQALRRLYGAPQHILDLEAKIDSLPVGASADTLDAYRTTLNTYKQQWLDVVLPRIQSSAGRKNTDEAVSVLTNAYSTLYKRPIQVTATPEGFLLYETAYAKNLATGAIELTNVGDPIRRFSWEDLADGELVQNDLQTQIGSNTRLDIEKERGVATSAGLDDLGKVALAESRRGRGGKDPQKALDEAVRRAGRTNNLPDVVWNAAAEAGLAPDTGGFAAEFPGIAAHKVPGYAALRELLNEAYPGAKFAYDGTVLKVYINGKAYDADALMHNYAGPK